MALLGPSGSGKTTLLNILAQRPISSARKLDGDVLINRAPASSATLRRAARYVEQDDCLIGSLTTRETLDFASRLGATRYESLLVHTFLAHCSLLPKVDIEDRTLKACRSPHLLLWASRSSQHTCWYPYSERSVKSCLTSMDTNACRSVRRPETSRQCREPTDHLAEDSFPGRADKWP